jgi:hypothetical protein
VPQIDVPIFTDPADSATYLAAVRQADAAIEAAKIAADATWDTALWIGAPTAVAALFAAGLAYLAAITAAKHQVKLETDKHEARVNAYAIRQFHLISLALIHIQQVIYFSKEMLSSMDDKEFQLGEFYMMLPDMIPKPMPDDWGDERWEEHALLGSYYIKSLLFTTVVYSGFIDGTFDFERIKQYQNISEDVKIDRIQNHLKSYIKNLESYETSLYSLRNAIPYKEEDILNNVNST